MDIIKQPMQSPDDAISLGSYKKYYKDLPVQFVMSNTNCRKVRVVSKPNRRTGSTHLRKIPPKHILGPSSSSGTVITSGTSVTCSSTVASTSPPRNHSLQQQQRRQAACNNFLAKFKQAKPVKETPSKNHTKSHSSRSKKKLLSPPQVESKATVGSFNLPTKVDLQEKKGSHYHAEHDPYYYLPTTETRSSTTLTPRRLVTLLSSRRTSKLDAYIQEITVQPNCSRDDDNDDSLKTSTTTRHSRHSRGANDIYTSNPKHSSSVSKTSSVVSTISPSRLCSLIKSPAMIPLQPVSPRDSSCLRRPEFSAAPSPLLYRPPTSLLSSSLTPKTQELASVVTAVTSPMEPFVANHIQVAVRLRPLQPRDLLCTSPTKRLSQFCSCRNHGRSGSCATDIDSSQEDARAWTLLSDNSSNALSATLLQKKSARNIPGRTAFALDHVFDKSTTSNQVYKVFVQPIVQAVLTGCHGTVFAYGPTGSGKTYTMQGGVIPQAATDLFEQLPPGPGGLIRAQYFEIYNETVLDLVHGRKAAGHISKNNRRVVSVQENLSGEVQVNASYHNMHTVDNVASLLAYGNRRRACGTTDVNKESSRSHAIFRLHVHVPQRSNCPTDAVTTATTTAMLNLVDLAGSENASKSNTSGLRKREGGKINQSLPSKKQPKHIGFRDSKLTRILQSSLEGNACTAILSCASASRMSVEETRSTLKFAASAKTIAVQPTVNVQVVSQASLIDSLRKELTESRAALQSLQAQLDAANQRGCVAGEAVSAVESSNTSEQSDMAETTPMDKECLLSQDDLYHEPSSPRSAMTTYCYHVDHDNDSKSPSEAVLVDKSRLSDTFRRQSESSQTLLCQKSITLLPSRSERQKSAFTSEPQKVGIYFRTAFFLYGLRAPTCIGSCNYGHHALHT